MRLATWNCSNGRVLEKYKLFMGLKPDVGVLQEVNDAIEKLKEPNCVWCPPKRVAGKEIGKKGLAIVTAPGYRAEPQTAVDSAQWSVVPVKVFGPEYELRLLAVWARVETAYIEGVHHAIEQYAGFLAGGPSVVMGDFNANPIWDDQHSPNFTQTKDLLASQFRLRSAYHTHTGDAFGKERKPSYFFWWKKERPFHIDYCFVPESWKIMDVVIDHDEKWAISDHRPLVVDARVD